MSNMRRQQHSKQNTHTHLGAPADPFAPDYAFAAVLTDGRVTAWGGREAGGNCGEVEKQLRRHGSKRTCIPSMLHDLADLVYGSDL